MGLEKKCSATTHRKKIHPNPKNPLNSPPRKYSPESITKAVTNRQAQGFQSLGLWLCYQVSSTNSRLSVSVSSIAIVGG